MKLRSMVALVLLLASSTSMAATTVYRCGQDGREYSQAPCPSGQALTVEDARSPEQRQQAQDAARREAKLGEQLTGDRLARESAAARQGAAGIAAKPSSAPAPSHHASAPEHKRKKHHHAKAAPHDPELTPPVRVPAEPKPSQKAASAN